MYRVTSDGDSNRARSIYSGLSGRLSKLIDAMVSPIAPRLALQRQKARMESAALLGYDAAKSKRWRRTHSAGSADTDLLQDLPKIRVNSRAMVRDDSNAAAMVRVLEDNIVGTGLRPQVLMAPETTPGMTDQQLQDWSRSCEQVFNDWADDQADASEHDSFWAMQRQVLRALVVDGECLLHRTFVDPQVLSWRTIGTAFEIADVDRLTDPISSFTQDIRSGVELGQRQQAVAYWITPRHPDESRRRWTDARMQKNLPERWARFAGGLPTILHVFRRERAGQTRGVPFFAPSFGLIESLNDMIETELVASQSAAKFCGFIKQTMNSAGLAGLDPNLQQEPNGSWSERLEPGTLRYLEAGEDVVSYSPNRPGNNWEPFVVRVLRSICAALGLPYELVLKDFGGMNFSSARVALLEARRGFEILQQLLIEQLCQPIFRSVVVDAVVSGVLPMPRGFLDNPRPFLRATWQPPAWGWVDPVKEVEASQLAIDNNLSTPQAEAARQGQDVESILQSRGRFLKRAAEVESQFGLAAGTLTTKPAPAGQAPANDGTDSAAGDAAPSDQPPAKGKKAKAAS